MSSHVSVFVSIGSETSFFCRILVTNFLKLQQPYFEIITDEIVQMLEWQPLNSKVVNSYKKFVTSLDWYLLSSHLS